MSLGGEASGGRQRQRGFALLLVLLVLTVGGAGLFLAARSGADSDRAEAGAERAELLGRARSAAIARSLMSTAGDDEAKQPRPGALSCPDQDEAGSAGSGGSEGAACEGEAAKLGRVPHRTLNVEVAFGDLWYAIAPELLNDGDRINPDVAGEGLRLDGRTGYAAVVLDPGSPINAAQNARAEDSDQPENFLEDDNAEDDVDFIDCPDRDDCNDRVRGITIDQLFSRPQYRVLAAVTDMLAAFHDEHGVLPRAAPFTGSRECEAGNHLGRLPIDGNGDCESADDGSFDEDLVDEHSNDLAAWVKDNDWLDFVVYRVDSECTVEGGGCTDAALTLDGDEGQAAVLAAAGRTRSEQDRGASDTDVADYLDQEPNDEPDTDEYRDYRPSDDDNDALMGVELP